VEFFLSRTSYDWLLEELDLKKPQSETIGPSQREYGRLVLEGTILSKRRLHMLVEGANVTTTKPDGSVETKSIPAVVVSCFRTGH
jgi:glutaminyl-tRNA synthetase